MKTSLRYRVSLLTVGLLVAGLVGWIPTANALQKATSVKSDTLVVAESVAPLTFDPIASQVVATWYPWPLVFDSLIRVRKNGSIASMLARTWTVSADRLTYTFRLRQGVKFQSGDPFTSDDVVFSYQRLLNKGIAYTKARFPTFVSVNALNTFTVQLKLSAPDAGFLNNLGDPFEVGTGILSRQAATKTDPATKMIGTGPYAMVDYTPDQSLTLVRNDNYWGVKPKTKNLKILYMPDQNAQVAALRANKVDLIFPSATSVRALAGTKDVIKKVQTASVIYLEFNSDFNPALRDLRVRRAIALALDRQAIVDKGLLGGGVPSAHIPPMLPFAVPLKDMPNYVYDPAQSKKLLADAGYAKGLDLTLDIFSTAPPQILGYIQVVQSQLKAVGINAQIVNQDFATWLVKLQTGKFDILGNYASYKADPIWYLKVRPGQGGVVPADIAALEKKIQGAQQKDIPSLLSAYEKLQASEVWPNLGIAAQSQWIATRPGVSGGNVDYTMSRSFLLGVTVSQ